jgi:flotillin
MREADALQYSIETQAKATAEQKRLEGQAMADAELAKGTADAEVIRLRGLAEAEAKEKLAEAFQKFGEAAVLDIIVKMLPDLAGQIAKPLASIDKLTVVDTGNGEGAARVSNYVTQLMSTAPEMLKSVSGIDVEAMIKGLTTRSSGSTGSKAVPVATAASLPTPAASVVSSKASTSVAEQPEE